MSETKLREALAALPTFEVGQGAGELQPGRRRHDWCSVHGDIGPAESIDGHALTAHGSSAAAIRKARKVLKRAAGLERTARLEAAGVPPAPMSDQGDEARRDGEMRVDEYTARVHDREWEAAPGGRDWTPGELTAALYAACVDRRALIRILDAGRATSGSVPRDVCERRVAALVTELHYAYTLLASAEPAVARYAAVAGVALSPVAEGLRQSLRDALDKFVQRYGSDGFMMEVERVLARADASESDA